MPIPDTKGKVIVSLLAGATAGLVAGLLLAPETGEDTRRSLAGEVDKLLKGPLVGKLKNLLAGLAGADHLAADAPPTAFSGAADGRSAEGSEQSEFANHGQ